MVHDRRRAADVCTRLKIIVEFIAEFIGTRVDETTSKNFMLIAWDSLQSSITPMEHGVEVSGGRTTQILAIHYVQLHELYPENGRRPISPAYHQSIGRICRIFEHRLPTNCLNKG